MNDRIACESTSLGGSQVDPKRIEAGDIVIGLMWVYAVKSAEGMYEKIKVRITLMAIKSVYKHSLIGQMLMLQWHK